MFVAWEAVPLLFDYVCTTKCVVSQGWKPAWAAGFLLLCSLPMGGLNRNLHGMSPCWDVPSPAPPQGSQVWGLSALCGWGQQHLSICCSSCWTAQCLPLKQTNPKSCWEGPGRERTGFLHTSKNSSKAALTVTVALFTFIVLISKLLRNPKRSPWHRARPWLRGLVVLVANPSSGGFLLGLLGTVLLVVGTCSVCAQPLGGDANSKLWPLPEPWASRESPFLIPWLPLWSSDALGWVILPSVINTAISGSVLWSLCWRWWRR